MVIPHTSNNNTVFVSAISIITDIHRICSTRSTTHVGCVESAMSNILEDSQIRWFAKATRSNQILKYWLCLKLCHMWGIYMCMCRFWPLSVMLHLPPPPRRHRFRPPAKPKNNVMIVTSSSDGYLLLIFINSFLKIIQGKFNQLFDTRVLEEME